MIKYLPKIYPDELVYSYLSRIYVHSGYGSHAAYVKEIFNRPNEYLDYNFINYLNICFKELLEKNISFDELLLEHTLLKYYLRFLPYDKRIEAYEYAISNRPGLSKYLPIPVGKRYLRYCPMCVKDDRLKYGECYFHVSHFIPNIETCSIHNCRLIDTEVINDKMRSATFRSLEELVDDLVFTESDAMSVIIAKYAVNVLRNPVDMNNKYLIGDYLSSKLSDKYFSKRGQRKKLDLLFNDLTNYYNGYDLSKSMIANIYVNKEINIYAILLLAIFERITEEELTNIIEVTNRVNEFEDEVWALFNKGYNREQISKILKVNRRTIQNIIAGNY